MKTSTRIAIATVVIITAGLIGYFWPQIWALLLFLPTLAIRRAPPTEQPRPDYDDSDAVTLNQDAARTDVDYRAAVRRAKAARARLRSRLGGDGSGADGNRDDKR